MPFKSSNCQVLYSNFEIFLLFDHQDLIHMSPNSYYYYLFYFSSSQLLRKYKVI